MILSARGRACVALALVATGPRCSPCNGSGQGSRPRRAVRRSVRIETQIETGRGALTTGAASIAPQEFTMFADEASDVVPILTDCTFGTLDGQDVVVVLQLARNPDDLLAGITTETVLAMTPDQARQLGAGLVASAGAVALRPAANDAGVPLEPPAGAGRPAPQSTPQD